MKYIEVDGNLILLNDVLGVTPMNNSFRQDVTTFSILYKNNTEVVGYPTSHQNTYLKNMGNGITILFYTKDLEKLREEVLSILKA